MEKLQPKGHTFWLDFEGCGKPLQKGEAKWLVVLWNHKVFRPAKSDNFPNAREYEGQPKGAKVKKASSV